MCVEGKETETPCPRGRLQVSGSSCRAHPLSLSRSCQAALSGVSLSVKSCPVLLEL